MARPVVFLSAGHGGKDPGAVAYNLYEKEINLQALLACKEVLERHDVAVVCSRTKDENDPKEEEVREANASGAVLALSFHANAGRGNGFEAYYIKGSIQDKQIAEFCEKYVKELGQNSRGLKDGSHLYFCKYTKMPAVIVESFFLDNDNDNDIGDTVEEQRAFGVAYAKATLEYLGIKYVENNKLYRVQVGAFLQKANADALVKKLKADGYSAYVTHG